MLKALEASSEGQSVPDVPEAQMVNEQLWVDKYAPKSFTELLSDEQTNREVSKVPFSYENNLLELLQLRTSFFGFLGLAYVAMTNLIG